MLQKNIPVDVWSSSTTKVLLTTKRVISADMFTIALSSIAKVA